MCPLNVSSSLPLAASHTLTVPSPLPVTIRWPSGEKATDQIAPLCPLSVSSSLPLATSHTLAVPSAAAGHNPLAVRGKGHRQHAPLCPRKRLQGQVSLPLPVIPFEPTLRIRRGFLQQLPHSSDIVLFPRLLR